MEIKKYPSPSADTAQASLDLVGYSHEDTAAYQCYDVAPYEMYTQSTERHFQPVSTEQSILQLFISHCLEFVYLVASHVVTHVHDQRFASLVILANIQAGVGSRVFKLVETENKLATLIVQDMQCLASLQYTNGTHCSKFFWLQVWNEDLWVDGV